jgi:hypothetical protein
MGMAPSTHRSICSFIDLEQVYIYAIGFCHGSTAHGPPFQVCFQAWETFRDCLLNEAPNFISDLTHQGIKCVVGGVHLRGDIVYAARSTVKIQKLKDIVSEPQISIEAESHQGLNFCDVEDAKIYVKALDQLERVIPVWPPTAEMLYAGEKMKIVEDLDRIASGLGSSRPKTIPLNEIAPLHEGWVAKREHSDGMRHVILPSWGIKERIWQGEKRWFQQQFAPLLIQLGEWRAIFVHCRHMVTIHARPKGDSGWTGTPQHDLWSLADIR